VFGFLFHFWPGLGQAPAVVPGEGGVAPPNALFCHCFSGGRKLPTTRTSREIAPNSLACQLQQRQRPQVLSTFGGMSFEIQETFQAQ